MKPVSSQYYAACRRFFDETMHRGGIEDEAKRNQLFAQIMYNPEVRKRGDTMYDMITRVSWELADEMGLR